jgi:hypothetical protein
MHPRSGNSAGGELVTARAGWCPAGDRGDRRNDPDEHREPTLDTYALRAVVAMAVNAWRLLEHPLLAALGAIEKHLVHDLALP